MKTNNIHVFAPFDLVEHSIFYEKVRNVTALDSAALSLSLFYMSDILRVCQIMRFLILYFPLENDKICYLLSLSSCNDIISRWCELLSRHTKTLLSIYWVCRAFYECIYNKTLNISHNSQCINGVLYEMCLIVSCMSVICDIVPSC